ncbi:MAG: hypothetical protein IMZ47_09415 [Firmicutes bacterium]|nr:hypothetical protein [Bacillota bacterium]
MKAILEFDLLDPDDRLAHLRCVKAMELAIACYDLGYLWHEAENAEETEEYKKSPYDWWSKRIRDILDENNITEDLIS